MDLTLVTTNPGKVAEIRRTLAPYGIRVRVSRRRLPELQADSLREVVRGKLAATSSIPGNVLVEDSGLFIPALGGFPGVYSAPVYRMWGFGPILELLRGRARTAVFRTVAGVRAQGRTYFFEGEVRGTIARQPAGSNGFGFDPVFIPSGETRTFAEMSLEEKNRWSHRARAIRPVGRLFSKKPERPRAARGRPQARRLVG